MSWQRFIDKEPEKTVDVVRDNIPSKRFCVRCLGGSIIDPDLLSRVVAFVRRDLASFTKGCRHPELVEGSAPESLRSGSRSSTDQDDGPSDIIVLNYKNRVMNLFTVSTCTSPSSPVSQPLAIRRPGDVGTPLEFLRR